MCVCVRERMSGSNETKSFNPGMACPLRQQLASLRSSAICSGFCSVLFYNNHGLGVVVGRKTVPKAFAV